MARYRLLRGEHAVNHGSPSGVVIYGVGDVVELPEDEAGAFADKFELVEDSAEDEESPADEEPNADWLAGGELSDVESPTATKQRGRPKGSRSMTARLRRGIEESTG